VNALERQREKGRDPSRQDRMDRAVGWVAALFGMLVVTASVPTPIKTGVLGIMGVLLGVFGHLLGARWLGGATIVVSSAAILAWMLT
jgi:hypothetical protein